MQYVSGESLSERKSDDESAVDGMKSLDRSIFRESFQSNDWLDSGVIALGLSSTLKMAEMQGRSGLKDWGEARPLISLGFGRSPFQPPRCLVDAVHTHAHQKEYLPVAGLPSLRTTLAAMYSKRYSVPYRMENTLIGKYFLRVAFLYIYLIYL